MSVLRTLVKANPRSLVRNLVRGSLLTVGTHNASGAIVTSRVTGSGTATIGRGASGSPSLGTITGSGNARAFKEAVDGTPSLVVPTASGAGTVGRKAQGSVLVSVPSLVTAGVAAVNPTGLLLLENGDYLLLEDGVDRINLEDAGVAGTHTASGSANIAVPTSSGTASGTGSAFTTGFSTGFD